MTKKITLSGMQPTGELHIGNYLGALKNFLRTQEETEAYFFIATYHSLSIPYEIKDKKQQIINLTRAYLAAGLDPKKSVIFDQVDVPAHTELAWIFSTLTPVAEVERMTQFKDKSAKHVKNINVGLLTYPVLQAADILMYKATAVPVGIDQEQHVELARKIARWFNNKYGEFFVEPETILTPIPKVMSLQHPEKKMSKSDGENSYIGLLDEPEVIKKKVMKAVTGMGNEDFVPPGAENLLRIITELGQKEVAQRYLNDIKAKTIRYGEMKEEVAEIIANYFADFRARYKKISAKEVEKVLKDGAKRANKVAEKTIEEVRKLIGVNA